MADPFLAPAVRDYAAGFAPDTVTSKVTFEQFYAVAFPKIYAFVRCQVRSVEATQEIVSRVFLKTWRHWDRAPSPEGLIQWVFRIAHTTLIDYWRVEGRHEAASVSLDELAEMAGEAATPEAEYATRQRAALLLQVLGDLNLQDRTLLALKFFGQRTNREVAGILGISEGAVSMRLLRALRRLRQRLQDQGL